ncbi:MAG: GatB/YqeY domain-containing protein [Deltaproteobacteria bacterium]|nr:GatB/YqeY domain-containing protein [Deltaproteobacteria bacterium]
MSLKQKIDEDLKKAMKARDAAALSATRLLKTEITKKEIELGKKDLDDAEVLKLVERQLKQRVESAEQFKKGNRPELAAQEEAEGAFLKAYLPQPLSPHELDQLVAQAIVETGAKTPREMGAVMKLAQAKAAGRADGKTLSELVKKKLTPKTPPTTKEG